MNELVQPQRFQRYLVNRDQFYNQTQMMRIFDCTHYFLWKQIRAGLIPKPVGIKGLDATLWRCCEVDPVLAARKEGGEPQDAA